MLVRLLLPALFAMVAAAPAAHVDVQVERPAPDDPGKTKHETVSITFRAVDYRPAWHAELRLELEDDLDDTGGGDTGPAAEPRSDETPRPRAVRRDAAPAPRAVRDAAPCRGDVRAGRVALPPPSARA